ncbi:MAG: sigma-E factor negative regulatory protein [Gammaproteobacteria bacterium]|nr:sigma-E factor negative regulatory protein [Gammaproteobacteria bacterium]MCG3145216.1 hypothetical protein [Gammaproteobacteria bacterium]
MTDEKLLKLSSYVDGACTEIERRAVENSLNDPEMRACWARYHLMGQAMRAELPPYLDRQFGDRLRQALGAEPTVLSPARRREHWTRPLAGAAIAATVAAVAVFGVRNMGTSTVSPGAAIATSPATLPAGSSLVAQQPFAPAAALVEAPAHEPLRAVGAYGPGDAFWGEPGREAGGAPMPSARSRLNSYIVNYSEQRAMMGSPGVLPYVKVVGYGTDQ